VAASALAASDEARNFRLCMGSSGVVSNLPGILAQIEARVYWRKGAKRRRALRSEASQSSQTPGAGVYCRSIYNNYDNDSGETMLASGKLLNQGRTESPSKLPSRLRASRASPSIRFALLRAGRASRRYNLGRRWWNRLVVCAAALLLSVACAFAGRAQDRAVTYAPADIRYGAQIYAAQCSACHGANGTQIGGVDLGGGQLRRASSDQDLRAVLANGIPGTAMPPFRFAPSEVTAIVAYIRNMRNFDTHAGNLGDANRGRAWFEGAGGCMNCHRVNGKGPRVAPDLSEIGALRSADFLQRTLLDPNGMMLPMNRSVHAVTKDGKVINGRRLNEDSYSVQLIDEQEHLLSLDKGNLREYTVLTTSTMPSYKDKMSEQETADLIAYLLTLKGLR
jgi:putative heme-binding domain-containing protein